MEKSEEQKELGEHGGLGEQREMVEQEEPGEQGVQREPEYERLKPSIENERMLAVSVFMYAKPKVKISVQNETRLYLFCEVLPHICRLSLSFSNRR